MDLAVPPPYRSADYIVRFAAETWEFEGAAALRRDVFCAEQGIFIDDDRDAIDETATVIVAISTIAGQPDMVVGTVRINEADGGIWWGSRLAVARTHRRIHTLGPSLIRLAVSSAHARGCRVFLAHVQSQNEFLFRRMHWHRRAEVELHGLPHVFMQADLHHYPPIADGATGFVTHVGVPLAVLAAQVRDSRGFAHKRDISAVLSHLGVGARDMIPVGDDAAVISSDDGYLLFAIEGFVEDFIAADPWFAGYCGVMVNISDIAAMGGTSIAIVDAVWSKGEASAAPLLAGLRDAAERYCIPIAGGHSNLRSPSGQLAVAILGKATHLITSFDASPGDAIVVATDLRGRFRDSFPWWDASTGADPKRLRDDLTLLPALARDGLVRAGKDISMAGVLGTAMMMLEASGCGGTIDLSQLPKPDWVALDRWLAAFPSFGFIFAVNPCNVAAVTERFQARDIACGMVGTVDAGSRVDITNGYEHATVWDFREPFIGCGQTGIPVEILHA